MRRGEEEDLPFNSGLPFQVRPIFSTGKLSRTELSMLREFCSTGEGEREGEGLTKREFKPLAFPHLK